MNSLKQSIESINYISKSDWGRNRSWGIDMAVWLRNKSKGFYWSCGLSFYHLESIGPGPHALIQIKKQQQPVCETLLFDYLSDVYAWRGELLSRCAKVVEDSYSLGKNSFYLEQPEVLGFMDTKYICDRDGGQCVYCGSVAGWRNGFSVDHVYAPKRSAKTESAIDVWHIQSPSNLVSCCVSCNSAKGNRPVDKHITRLRDKGITPNIPGEVGLTLDEIKSKAIANYGYLINRPGAAEIESSYGK